MKNGVWRIDSSGKVKAGNRNKPAPKQDNKPKGDKG